MKLTDEPMCLNMPEKGFYDWGCGGSFISDNKYIENHENRLILGNTKCYVEGEKWSTKQVTML